MLFFPGFGGSRVRCAPDHAHHDMRRLLWPAVGVPGRDPVRSLVAVASARPGTSAARRPSLTRSSIHRCVRRACGLMPAPVTSTTLPCSSRRTTLVWPGKYRGLPGGGPPARARGRARPPCTGDRGRGSIEPKLSITRRSCPRLHLCGRRMRWGAQRGVDVAPDEYLYNDKDGNDQRDPRERAVHEGSCS